jgi:hypothetical protein
MDINSFIKNHKNEEKIQNTYNTLLDKLTIICNSNPINLHSLSDIIYEITMYHNLSKLFQICANSQKYRSLWKNIDTQIQEKSDLYKHNINLYKNINKLLQKTNNNNDIYFIKQIIKYNNKNGLEYYNTPNYNNIQSVLNKMNMIIKELICQDIPIKTLYENFHSLILLRYKYSKLLYFDNYINTKSTINLNNLKILLKKLIDETNDICHKELSYMCSKLKKNKLDISDIQQYIITRSNKYMFNLSEIFSIICKVISQYFLLEFIKVDNPNTWNKKVDLYIIYHKKHIFGYIYIDLYKRTGKIHQIMSLVLSDPIMSDNIKQPYYALIGNYDNQINYLDIVNIFIEFGSIIHNIFHRTPYMTHNQPSSILFINKIMECLAHDIDTIKLFSNNNYKQIRNIFNLDKYFKIKYKCIYALYDYYLHSSEIINENNIYNKFTEITRMILDKSNNLVNIELTKTNITELIYNGGLIHCNILNIINSYNIYNYLKTNNKFDIIVQLLQNTNDTFHNLLLNYIDKNKINIDIYNTTDYLNDTYTKSLNPIIPDKRDYNNIQYITDRENYYTEN